MFPIRPESLGMLFRPRTFFCGKTTELPRTYSRSSSSPGLRILRVEYGSSTSRPPCHAEVSAHSSFKLTDVSSHGPQEVFLLQQVQRFEVPAHFQPAREIDMRVFQLPDVVLTEGEHRRHRTSIPTSTRDALNNLPLPPKSQNYEKTAEVETLGAVLTSKKILD